MQTTIHVAPDAVWSDPAVEGLDASDGEWRLDVDRYRAFLDEAAGLSPADGLSASDCYRVGNRLQGLIEERKRHDAWDPALLEEFPDVDSLQQILWLARFFRACHTSHDAGETVLPPSECQ
jgi:hypothetical protein